MAVSSSSKNILVELLERLLQVGDVIPKNLLGPATMSFSWANFMKTFNPTPLQTTNPDNEQVSSQRTLGASVQSLAGPDGFVDPLAVADYISWTVNTGFAMTASKVFGYNLEFTVHEKGCVLVTGASG
ncbi:hypothetical protein HDU99_005464, partial [Rhizoclosmatium hyalinum]